VYILGTKWRSTPGWQHCFEFIAQQNAICGFYKQGLMDADKEDIDCR
jgi:hypothetical protein